MMICDKNLAVTEATTWRFKRRDPRARYVLVCRDSETLVLELSVLLNCTKGGRWSLLAKPASRSFS